MCCNTLIVLSLPSSVHTGQLLVLMSHQGKVRAQQKTVGSLQRQAAQCRPVYVCVFARGEESWPGEEEEKEEEEIFLNNIVLQGDH